MIIPSASSPAAVAESAAPIAAGKNSQELNPNLLQLRFPRNVYAALLFWSEGRVDYLHYGLFDSVKDPIWQAQDRASRRLWAQLPPPCRVLEVGIGLGQTLARLHGAGFNATGITPEPAQRAYAQALHGSHLPVEIAKLEEFAPLGPRFDLLLLQESAQYIQPLSLFESAERLLGSKQASLVVMDEFALTRANDADFGLHLLPHFKALAQRFGWQLVHEEDVTAAAALTLDVLQALTLRFAARLRQELGLSDADIAGLDTSTARYARCYKTAVMGYRLLRFERQTAPLLRPVVMDGHAAATAPEAVAMRSLFQRVFGRELGVQEWQWKYGQGRGSGVALAARDGSFSAFYGGVTRPVHFFGQPVQACQICDVMVEPSAHTALQRHGPGYQAGASFLETQIGWARPHALGFGFPTDRALRVAERLGLYERVDEVVQLRWPAMPAGVLGDLAHTASMAFRALDLQALDEGHLDWSAVQAAWAAMAADLRASVLGVRDAAWLRYRYALKPDGAYEALLVPAAQAGVAPGVVIFRRHPDHLEVLDLVAPATRMPALITAVRHEAAASPTPVSVLAWITASHAQHLRQPGDAAVLEPLNLFVPANAHTPGVSPAALRGHWFLTAGDTDFR